MKRDRSVVEDILWRFLISAEVRCNPNEDILDRIEIEQAFEYFRNEELSTAYPRWQSE